MQAVEQAFRIGDVEQTFYVILQSNCKYTYFFRYQMACCRSYFSCIGGAPTDRFTSIEAFLKATPLLHLLFSAQHHRQHLVRMHAFESGQVQTVVSDQVVEQLPALVQTDVQCMQLVGL